MNHLLRTLTESQAYENGDSEGLKLLLSSVKEQRNKGSDVKNSNDLAFFESLDEVLNDMKTITMDNHDAEAFLRPVTKSEVPDYAEYIKEPMDLQTMTRKVKLKQYKSKKDFMDDLDLIWTNCWTYNAMPDHPLRKCAARLKDKADNLLKHITDRKERVEPFISGDSVAIHPTATTTLRVRGPLDANVLNGTRFNDKGSSSTPEVDGNQDHKLYTTSTKFRDMPAIERTAEGMKDFLLLQDNWRFLNTDSESMGDENDRIGALLNDLLQEEEGDDGDDMHVNEAAGSGDKRKQSGRYSPRKRVRISGPAGITDIVFEALQTDYFIANGVPRITHSSYAPRRRRKRLQTANPAAPSEKTLISKMNHNISTLQRLRKTHALLANMKQDKDDGAPMAVDYKPPLLDPLEPPDDEDQRWTAPLGASGIDLGGATARHCLGWMIGKVLEHAGFQGATKSVLDMLSCLAEEYMSNLGRTLKFTCDQHGRSMSTSEILAHSLSGSGVGKVQELGCYIQDDIVRYGTRLEELDKKLTAAYFEAFNSITTSDDAIFDEEDAEDDSAFVMGGFADAFGEDFLGLRELGIADEHGLASLSVPRRLLKGSRRTTEKDPISSKQATLPFPPPHSYPLLDSNTIKEQIGLLQHFYNEKVSVHRSQLYPSPPQPESVYMPSVVSPLEVAPLQNYSLPSYVPPGPAQPNKYTLPIAPVNAVPLSQLPVAAPTQPEAYFHNAQGNSNAAMSLASGTEVIVIPDDTPDPSRVKISPIGIVTMPNVNSGTGGGGKKKFKKYMNGGDGKVSWNDSPMPSRKSSSAASPTKKGLGITVPVVTPATGNGSNNGTAMHSAMQTVPHPIIASG